MGVHILLVVQCMSTCEFINLTYCGILKMDVLWLWSATQPCTGLQCNFNNLSGAVQPAGNYCFQGLGLHIFAS